MITRHDQMRQLISTLSRPTAITGTDDKSPEILQNIKKEKMTSVEEPPKVMKTLRELELENKLKGIYFIITNY